MRNIEQVPNFKSYDDVKNYFISKQATGMRIGVGLGVCPIYLLANWLDYDCMRGEMCYDWKKYFVIMFTAITVDTNDIEPVYVKVPFTPTNIGHVLAFYKKAIILETIKRFMEIHKHLAPEMDFHEYMTVNFNNMPLTKKDIEELDVVHRFGEYLVLENPHCFVKNYDEISSMMDYCGMFNGFTQNHISKIMENALHYSWCFGFSPRRFPAKRRKFIVGKSKNTRKNYVKSYAMFEDNQHAGNFHPKNMPRVIINKDNIRKNGVKFKSPVKTRNDAIRRLIFLLSNSRVEITFS